jgi:hypothetical protein
MRKTLIAAGVAGGLFTAMPLMASPLENEIDTTGLAGTVAIAYGDHTVNSALATSVDVDSYSFAGIAGDQVRMLVRTFSNDLDASLVLRNPVGAVVGSAGCIANFVSNCTTGLDHTLATSGNFTLAIADTGLDNAGNYQLHLDRYPPVNNWVGFQYSTPVAESLGHTTDSDFFAFNGVSSTGISVTLASSTNDLDLALEVWDPTGTRISDTSCIANFVSNCSTFADLNLSLSGVYKVGVSDLGADNAGNYRLQVSCLYGNCPSPLAAAPVPIPEPSTYAMFLSGIGALALFARRRSQRKS